MGLDDLCRNAQQFLLGGVAVSHQPALEHDQEGAAAALLELAQRLAEVAGQALNEQCHVTSIPKRFSTMMREIWELQERLDKRQGRRAEALVTHPRFRAAYDFLLLREQCGELEPGLGDWWTQYQQADEHDREHLVRNLGQKAAPGKRRRRRPRRGAKKNDD